MAATPYELSGHAQRRIARRSIRAEWIAATLTDPEQVEADRSDPSVTHALRRIPEAADRVLRVIYNHTADPVRIVTVYFDRRLRRTP